ncbi:uncharacterized protein N7469_011100 [Penicillium citrinum]|uniref:Uncharacterized protein n=1 Tax=Penicillium citrinum TaxID=5077 RepID=A0A9W9TDE0_PENCI|nr:uncharacterized protein N7469_011100 [Penicillium citrinum]KAJ5217475.1 hypothetical protein N7469_011100 [Penicillium citrinum]
MRPTQILTIISAAGISFIPSVSAALGFDCLQTLHSLDTPRFVKVVQEVSCKAGCEPRSLAWASHGKEMMRGLIEDGSAYSQITEGKAAAADFLDSVFENLRGKCEEKLNGGHMCQDEEQLQETTACVKRNSRWAELKALPVLLPFAKEENCRRLGEYLNSEQLWKKDLPSRAQSYADHCHDEL